MPRWEPPTKAQQSQAISLLTVPRLARSWLLPELFAPAPDPEPDDWNHMTVGQGQTFERYIAAKPNQPSSRRGGRNKIYIQPLGEADDSWPDLHALAAGCSAFYGLETVLLPFVTLEELEASGGTPIRSRIRTDMHAARHVQIHARDINQNLKSRIPADGFTMCAVTMVDVYKDDFNFLMGLAFHKSRAGVFSFHRLQPNAPECEYWHHSLERQPGDDDALLRHAFQLLSHELGHTFYLNHCVYFSCLMQGFNSLEEAQRRIPDLCPVCLRKLLWCKGDESAAAIRTRYERLHDFYAAHPRSFGGRHLAWVRQRLGRPELPPEEAARPTGDATAAAVDDATAAMGGLCAPCEEESREDSKRVAASERRAGGGSAATSNALGDLAVPPSLARRQSSGCAPDVDAWMRN